MRRILLSILVLSILVASTLVGCGGGQSTPPLTMFSIAGGNISVMKAGTGSWTGAQVGMSLEVGDTIKSGDNSTTEITFVDGTTIELQAGTEIEVASLATTDTGSSTIVLKQKIGSIIFRVTKIIDPASRYEVETPTGAVVARGSIMWVSVIEDGTTQACNLEGDIWAIAQGMELQIPEGRCCIIRPGQPPELIIRTWYDLDAIRNNLDSNYTLVNNLDSTTAGYTELASPTANGGKGWEQIGTWPDVLTGSFDGQGYEIRDLFINRPDESEVGLFFRVDEGGIIKNLGVMNATVTGYDLVGGLVGTILEGTVSNSYFDGSVSGRDRVGSLVGYNNVGTVSDSYSTGNVTGERYVGGLVGLNEAALVTNSYSTGSVTGELRVGGLVGFNEESTVTNSYSTGYVTGTSYVGGLVGLTHIGVVSDSFWDTQTSGQATSDGGTGKTTAEMQDISIFSSASWDIIAVTNPSTRNLSYTWNIPITPPDYPFLSWQP